MNSKITALLKMTWTVTLIVLFAFIIIDRPQITKSYGTISDLTVSVADSTPSVSTTYTVQFTVQNTIPRYGGRINIQIIDPGGTSNGSSWKNNSPNFNSAAVANGTSPNSIYYSYSFWNGGVFGTSQDISAGTTITLNISGIINPEQKGYYFAHVWTSTYYYDIDGSSDWNGEYNSPYFEIGSNTNLTGTITDSDGNPVTNASVSINNYSGSSYSYYYAKTDKNGVYGIGDIGAGTYNFTISGPYITGSNKVYFPPDTSTVTIAASGVTTKNASFMAATKTISGKITKNSANGLPVTNAIVYLSRLGGNGYASVYADSNGNYSVTLTSGTWYISLGAKDWPADWSYTIYNETVSFASDNSIESKTKDFIVDSVDSTVTGMLRNPDGSIPSQYAVGIGFKGEKNRYFSASISADGSFTAMVAEGTYSVNGWVSDSNYSFPQIANFSVDSNSTYSLGTVTLVEKTDTITGIIRDNFGDPVSGVSIYAWKSNGSYDWANTFSASNGTYTLKVVPGDWQISAYPQWNSGYIYSGKTTAVTVASGTPTAKNFTFQKCTATINGKVTDPEGNILSSLYSWVSAGDGSQEWGNIGTSVENGIFTLQVPSGTWNIKMSLYNSEYGSPDDVTVTIANNEVKSVTLQAVRNDVTVTGTVFDENGNALTGKWMSIFATKGRGGSWINGNLNQDNGTYSLNLSAGTWNLGWWMDPSTGYSSGSGNDLEFTVVSGENKAVNISLKKLDSVISGKATRSDGTAMQYAWITADSRDPNEKRSADYYYYSNGASSNENGDYQIRVPAGSYWVGGSMWSGSGVINPKRQKVTVDANNPATANLTFRNADATISGTVTNGEATSSYVTAWSEDGGYAEVNSSNDGAYSLAVSSGSKWHLKASKKIGNDVYKSEEYIVDLTNSTNANQDITLIKQSYTLPDTQTVTFDPTKQQSVTLEDGTEIVIPANALATSGQITLTIEPDIELAEEADAKPLDYGYNIIATTGDGQQISQFNDSVTIEDHYTDQTLLDSRVLNANEIGGAYYNESTGTWDELTGTVNEQERTVTYQTNHFSKFALVSASDTTPPSTPTEITATPGDRRVALAWTNPTQSDLAGIKIYRSTTSGTVGDLVTTISNVTTKNYFDTDLTNGTTYYYTLRAFDQAGNLSIISSQVLGKPAILPITGLDKPSHYISVAGLLFTIMMASILYQQRARLLRDRCD